MQKFSAALKYVGLAVLNLRTFLIRCKQAYEENTGTKHPLDSRMDVTRRSPGKDPLIDANNGQLWYGSISVGTPAKPFTGELLRALPALPTDGDLQWTLTLAHRTSSSLVPTAPTRARVTKFTTPAQVPHQKMLGSPLP